MANLAGNANPRPAFSAISNAEAPRHRRATCPNAPGFARLVWRKRTLERREGGFAAGTATAWGAGLG